MIEPKIFDRLIDLKSRVCKLETCLIEGYSKAMVSANFIMLKRSFDRLKDALLREYGP